LVVIRWRSKARVSHVDGRAAGQQRMRLGWPAVVPERPEHGGAADEIERIGIQTAKNICAGASHVPRHNAVGDIRIAIVIDAAAVADGRPVARDGTAGDGHGATVENPAAALCRVSRDGAAGNGHRTAAAIADGAAAAVYGDIAGDGAVGDGRYAVTVVDGTAATGRLITREGAVDDVHRATVAITDGATAMVAAAGEREAADVDRGAVEDSYHARRALGVDREYVGPETRERDVAGDRELAEDKEDRAAGERGIERDRVGTDAAVGKTDRLAETQIAGSVVTVVLVDRRVDDEV